MEATALRGRTAQLGNATLVAGTTTTLSLSVATAFAISGKVYSKAIASNQATPTTDANTGAAFLGVKANKGCVFVLGLDASGNTVAVQGEITDLDASGNFVIAPEFPATIPATMCPIGYYIIKAGATADATTGWIMFLVSVSLTILFPLGFFTLVNIATLPTRPQIA